MGLTKEVTLLVAGQESKYHIAATPSRKAIDVLDKDNRLVELSKISCGHLSEMTQKLVKRINQDDDIIDLFPPGTRKEKRI